MIHPKKGDSPEPGSGLAFDRYGLLPASPSPPGLPYHVRRQMAEAADDERSDAGDDDFDQSDDGSGEDRTGVGMYVRDEADELDDYY